MLKRLMSNGAWTIIESPDRFARDLMVQLAGQDMLKARGVTLSAASAPMHFVEETPTAVLVRQVLGTVAGVREVDLSRRARGRAPAQAHNDRPEGRVRKSHAAARPNVVKLAKALAHKKPKVGKPSLRAISAEFAARGIRNERGRPFNPKSVPVLLAHYARAKRTLGHHRACRGSRTSPTFPHLRPGPCSVPRRRLGGLARISSRLARGSKTIGRQPRICAAGEKPSKKGWDHQMKRGLLGAAALTALGFALAGCATRSQDIVSAYVSPIQYESYSCAQLREEAARVSSRAALASGMQDQNATSDAVATGVALVVFWPAAFLVHGNGANAQEVSQLKGDMDAIEQANVRKKCGIQFSSHTG